MITSSKNVQLWWFSLSAVELRKRKLKLCLIVDKQRKTADCANRRVCDVTWIGKLSRRFM